ncbi:uncharacterized protein LOC123010373 [Tribolium madens]|uniref:uncharacterized protein LOC123010373 n=1 Tax=Tribolium madens TaxID=41895 RepID=UPI001CF766D3|nr:uncharacterized protein LOC123010373 [Tribolium madens]
MVKAILIVVLALSIFLLNFNTEAAVARYKPHPNRKPGGCFNEKVGHLTAGAVVSMPGKCAEMTCDSTGWMEHISCGIVALSRPNCVQKPVDLKKPYPECCRIKQGAIVQFNTMNVFLGVILVLFVSNVYCNPVMSVTRKITFDRKKVDERLCMDPVLKDVNIGGEVAKQYCFALECRFTGQIEVYGCNPVYNEDPNCTPKRLDISKSFPECCPISCLHG